MKRPLCIASIIYIIGILLGLYLKLSIALFIVFLFFVIVFVKYLVKECENKRRYILKTIVYILILIAGIMNIKQIDYRYEKFYDEIEGIEEIKVEAIILKNIEEKDYSKTYEIQIYKINESKKYKGIKLILNLKKNKLKENIDFQYGDYIILSGEFKIPNEARNYGGFNYKQYLKGEKIYGIINVSNNICLIKKDNGNLLGKVVNILQNSIKNNMEKILPEETSNLCVGILIGIRNELSEDIESNFKESNLTHMLAVSGSHITYIILGLTILLNKTNKRFAKIITILFLIFFMALTNFTPSVMRACFMGIIMLVSKLVYKKTDVWNNLALSALIILVINPYTILNIGFILSYGGTIGIVLLSKKMSSYIKEKINLNNKILDYIIEALVVTLSANIILIPIMAYSFNKVSFTFWISNVLASPFMGAVVILGFIVYIISLLSISIAKIIAIPLNIVLILLIKMAEICSKIPFSVIIVKTPYILSIVIYYLIVILILNLNPIKKRINIEKIGNIKNKIINKRKIILTYIICIILFFSTIIGVTIHNTRNKLTIHFIDVGQGDSSLIITPTNKKILIDGGGSEMGTFDVGEKILLPYLLDRRIISLDYVLISHFDTDHVGGILYILEKIKVKNVILSKQGENSTNYEEFKAIVKKKKTNLIIVKQGDKVQIDKFVYFDILFPEEEQLQKNILNNNSIVAKLTYNNFSALFTGDIEEIAEKRLIEKYKDTNYLKCQLLKVAHHGSKSSSIQEILDYIQPKIALIGVGADNKFGHPNEGVLKRLKNMNCKIYRTDEMGEINIYLDKKRKNKDTNVNMINT